MADYGNCPGVAVGVCQGGRPLYCQGFGHRDREAGLPVTVDTLMSAASLTKSVTAVAIMQLQEAGLLTVADPLVQYLPEFSSPDPAFTAGITLHHLLTNSAGLPPLPTLRHALVRSMLADPQTENRAALERLRPIESVFDLLDYLSNLSYRPLIPSGRYFSYSNEGFALLGAVIERVSGMSYRQYVTDRILRPAGMFCSTFGAEGSGFARHYLPGGRDQPPIPVTLWESGPLTPSGGLRSSVGELLSYLEIFRTGGLVGSTRLLAPESVAAMMHPHQPVTRGLFYGYGLYVTPGYHGVTLVEHLGASRGISAALTVVPERGLTAVLLANQTGLPANRMLLSAVNLALELPMQTEQLPYSRTPLPEAELARYAGRYENDDGGFCTVSPSDGGLLILLEWAGRLRVQTGWAGDHRFRARGGQEVFLADFLPVEDGSIGAVLLSRWVFRRVE